MCTFSALDLIIFCHVDVLIAMDLVNPMLVGREGGPDLHIRLYKTGDIVAVVPVTVALLALMPPCKLTYCT